MLRPSLQQQITFTAASGQTGPATLVRLGRLETGLLPLICAQGRAGRLGGREQIRCHPSPALTAGQLDQDAQFHGVGVHILKDGSRYEGEYAKELRHGHGVQHWANGQRYSGQWLQGQCHGYGSYVWPAWPDCATYKGGFEGSLRHGAGVFFHADGAREVGLYEAGEPIGMQVYTTQAQERTERSHPCTGPVAEP